MAATEKDTQKLVRDFYESYSSGNWDTLRNFVADSAKLVSMPLGKTWNGQAGVIDYFRLHKTALDVKFQINRLISCGDMTTVELTSHGMHKAPYPLPNGDTIPPTGRPLDAPLCHIIQWKDGKIAELHTYFDIATLLTQMGVGLTEGVNRH